MMSDISGMFHATGFNLISMVRAGMSADPRMITGCWHGWGVGLLVHFLTDHLFIGLSAYWSIDRMVYWSFGPLIHWSNGPVVKKRRHRHSGLVDRWSIGLMDQ